MADIGTENADQTLTGLGDGVDAAGNNAALAIDRESLRQLLKDHAKEMATAFAKLIDKKLAALKSETMGSRRAAHLPAEPRENPEKIEGDEDAWLTKHMPGDRKHLKKVDKELCALEETLEGPQRLLEKEEGYNRPLVKGEATWQLPKYQPVPPDNANC
jgi:hypothetical protein